MADLYHDLSQALLADYLSVRGCALQPVDMIETLHSLKVSLVSKGMNPYPTVAYVYRHLQVG
jgi:hypothetical protein